MENKQTIKIEKKIPICGDTNRGIRPYEFHYPFRDMEVGDSFAIDIKEKFINRYNVQQSSMLTTARLFCNYNKLDWKFTTRKIGNQIRMWRIN